MKTTIILMLAGALLGVTAASFIVPPALSWYSTPGGLPDGAQIQAVVQIAEVIRYTTSKLLQGQLIGGIIGAVAGLVMGVIMAVKQRPKSASPLPPRATPA